MNKLLGIIFFSCFLISCSSKEPPPIRPVAAIKVNASSIANQYTYSGIVKPRYEIPLSFQVNGKLEARAVDLGDKVKKGELLASLDQNDLKLQLQIKQEKLDGTKISLDLAQAEYNRYLPLVQKGFVTQSQLHQFKAKYENALADWKQASSDVAATKRQLSYADLYSEADGVIIDVLAAPGEIVASGKPVLKVATTKEIEVVLSVPEQRVEQWRNQLSDIDVVLWAFPNKHYQAKLRDIDSDADPATRTYIVKLSVLNPDESMQLGMTANITLKLRQSTPLITLPLSAIFYQKKQPLVWVIDQKTLTVNAIPVTLGDYTKDDSIIIQSGLKDGQLVVTAGVHNLTAGQKVTILDESHEA